MTTKNIQTLRFTLSANGPLLTVYNCATHCAKKKTTIAVVEARCEPAVINYLCQSQQTLIVRRRTPQNSPQIQPSQPGTQRAIPNRMFTRKDDTASVSRIFCNRLHKIAKAAIHHMF